MSAIQTYFQDFLTNIRLPDSLKKALISAHTELREQLKSDDLTKDLLVESFLQGSYARSTCIKPAPGKKVDVDVIVVTNIDHDTVSAQEALEMGNLCRHTLCMTDLYQSKSKLVAKRLTNIDPNIHTTYAERYLDIDETGALVPDLSSFDIIIDSTGEDQVLALLSATEWKRKIVFCSSSVGLGAKRLYINIQRTKLPHFENFLNLVEPYFQKDSNDFNLDALPRDGIGCWHPLFPARADDMWFAACTTVKALEAFVQNSTEKGISLIYETQTEDGLFNGLRLIEKQYEYREN